MNRLTALLSAALGFGAVSVCHADRDLDVPTQHMYASSVDAAGMTAITDQGYRLHDLEVTSTAPYRFAGSFVKNSGPYAKAYWWTADKTEAGLIDFYTDRNARILDLEVTVTNGVRRYHGTFIQNSGADQVAWWWFDNATYAEVVQEATNKNARITDLDVVQIGSTVRYAGVMVKNTGDFHRNWGMFIDKTEAQIQAILGGSNRIVDIEPQQNGRFSGVYELNNGSLSWFQTNKTWDELKLAVGQFGSRITDVERRNVNGQARYSFILMNNSNALETRIGELLRNNSDGDRGFFLKQVGGSTLGQLLADKTFYPASSIKVLEHIYYSRRVGLGLSALTPVPHYSDSTNDTHPLDNSTVVSNPTLTFTVRNMMLNSNNQSTNALQDFAGGANGVTGRSLIDSFKVNTLGIGNTTRISHKFGAGGPANDPANSATARELARIYELANNGTVLNLTGLAFFRNNILNETSGSGFDSGVDAVIVDEASLIGLPIATRDSFRTQVRLMWKAGNWVGTTYVSAGAWIRIPYRKPDGVASTKSFVLSAYVDNSTFNTLGMTGTVLPEIMRDEIRKALLTYL